jgi:hypothetical protein
VPDEVSRVAQPQTPQSCDAQIAPASPKLGDASEFCPVCNRRLAARACKLVCSCGYYMSCSDYY